MSFNVLITLKAFLKEEEILGNKGNLCTRSIYLLCLLPSMLYLRYSIYLLSLLSPPSQYYCMYLRYASKLHPHAIGVGLSSSPPLPLLVSWRPLGWGI